MTSSSSGVSIPPKFAPAAGREPLLSIRDLTVEYVTPRGNVKAVDRVSFDVGQGEVFGLAGESGSGKSTAAMAALRLLQPPAIITGGTVTFKGRDILAMNDEELRQFRWKEIALVFQSAMNALNPVMTVGAQIADAIVSHEGVSQEDALGRAVELLKLVGIESSRLGSYPHQLSGGMRQRVVIAIALALKPPMLFMDEPTTALDVVVQKEILQQIAELKETLGFSILFITHDLSLMLEFCDTVGILYAGRLCEVAPAKTLFSKPQHPYTSGLMNSFPELSGPRHRMLGIAGSPPDMMHPPSGCRFHPRCTRAVEICSSALPELQTLAPRHLGACHLAEPYLGRPSKAPEAPALNVASPDDDRITNPDLLASMRPASATETPMPLGRSGVDLKKAAALIDTANAALDETRKPPAVFRRDEETAAAPEVKTSPSASDTPPPGSAQAKAQSEDAVETQTPPQVNHDEEPS